MVLGLALVALEAEDLEGGVGPALEVAQPAVGVDGVDGLRRGRQPAVEAAVIQRPGGTGKIPLFHQGQGQVGVKDRVGVAGREARVQGLSGHLLAATEITGDPCTDGGRAAHVGEGSGGPPVPGMSQRSVEDGSGLLLVLGQAEGGQGGHERERRAGPSVQQAVAGQAPPGIVDCFGCTALQ
ncbi:hypothetical protein GHK86_06340 [Acidimicrobiaceae bacterium USS-CC1]|uniref:Uncharacterized protein n=1 Tax=Acidiferrimicrobium australe TaxID=2664430 RepID=A0ABW9QRS1_9ACTN|nr:hypothetical protein [Acidiferrimicrobium australe]